MIIKLYDAGKEIKKYDSLEILELQILLKNKKICGNYNIEFYGDSKEIIRSLIWNIFETTRINVNSYIEQIQIIDSLKCAKDDFFSSIFYLIVCKEYKCNISFFDDTLKVNFNNLDLTYEINFLE